MALIEREQRCGCKYWIETGESRLHWRTATQVGKIDRCKEHEELQKRVEWYCATPAQRKKMVKPDGVTEYKEEVA